MQINLKEARRKIDISAHEAAEAAEINLSFYKQYEEKNEIPCKYVYKIWKKHKTFPIPKDFFYYTSFTLQANMTYYGLSQADIAIKFGYSSQGAVSRILAENIPMYEMKEVFLKVFHPLIVPLKHKNEGHLTYITTLTAKGNFMNRKIIKEIEENNE